MGVATGGTRLGRRTAWRERRVRSRGRRGWTACIGGTFAAWAWVALLLLWTAVGAPLSAQQSVRGRVVDEGVATPIPGALVTLLAADGSRVRSVLTNAAGAFAIADVPPGAYRLRAEMIGRRSVESPAFDVAAGADPPQRTLELPVQPITLSAIDVSTAERCSGGRQVAVATYQVWQEAEKALRSAQVTSEETLYRFRVRAFQRELDRRSGEVTSETVEEQVWVTSDPFNSLPPAEIERAGYVREEGGETIIYGPNTDLLLSGEFQRTHCFALRETRDRPGLVGLTFEPVDGRNLPDIEGVLWVDAASAELRTLEFRYRNLPRILIPGDYTGFAEFQRIDGGHWIIRSWRLRSPALEEAAEVTGVERVPGSGSPADTSPTAGLRLSTPSPAPRTGTD
jgi:hypothetical protein